MIDKKQFLVNVRCATYNHSAYIEDAMNGFAMQQTKFPFICSIIDDASTDGEQDILKKYLDEHFELGEGSGVINEETDDYVLTLSQHKTNKNCYFAVLLLKYNHYGNYESQARRWTYLKDWEEECKYIALCEGDDYWIDPLKLQKQVDFLENNPVYSLCFHNAIKYYVQSNEIKLFNHLKNSQDLSIHDAIHNWFVPTASILVMKEYLQTPVWLAKIYSGDYSLVLKALNGGRIFGLKDIMSVYRINTIGSSATARMVGKSTFIMEEHLKLLESFNNGTNYKFNKEVSSRIVFLKKNIKFQKLRERKSLLILFNYTLYEKCFLKIKRISKKIIECFRA